MRRTVEVEIGIEIDRPRAQVWAYVTDPATLASWIHEFDRSAALTEGEPGVGAQIRYEIGERSSTLEIVEWDPPRRMSWDGPPLEWAGGAGRPRGSHTLEERGPARTMLVTCYRPELSGTQVLLSPYLKGWLRRRRTADAATLKRLIERDA